MARCNNRMKRFKSTIARLNKIIKDLKDDLYTFGVQMFLSQRVNWMIFIQMIMINHTFMF